MLSSLGKIFSRYIEVFLFIFFFSQRTGFWHVIQSVKSCFCGKIIKNISVCCLQKILPRVLSIIEKYHQSVIYRIPGNGYADGTRLVVFSHCLQWRQSLWLTFSFPAHQVPFRPWWHCLMRAWLVIKWLWVQSPLCLTTFFHGYLSWNIFCGHSLPYADSRRAAMCWSN